MHNNSMRLSTSQLCGFLLLILIVGFAYLLPLFISADPHQQDLMAILLPPDQAHWLGTDHYGRDMFTRVMHGSALSIRLSVSAVVCAALPGIALGLIAAWCGGWVDKLISHLADAFMALPGLLLVLLVLAFAPGKPELLFMGLALALWVEFFRVTRSLTQQQLAMPYVEASRLLGFQQSYLIRRIFLPALLPELLMIAGFSLSTALIAIATLSAISVGLQPPTAELGTLIADVMPYYADAPWLVLAPSVVILLFLFSIQLIGGARQHGE